jgi:hypothetical protein
MRTICMLMLTLGLVVGTGCGSDSPVSSGGGGDDGAGVSARLAFQLTQMGGAQSGAAGVPLPANLRCTRSIPATCSGMLTCPAATDAAPWHTSACAWLDTNQRKLFAAPRTDEMCTQIYGGAEVARITGTVDGKDISFRITRTNGCEIARWELHQPLWGEVAPNAA